MDDRKQLATLLMATINELRTEFGFVLEPFTLDNGLTVINVYDIKENRRLFMLNKEEE